MALKLLTYATQNFLDNATALAKNALSVGFNEACVLGPEDIRDTKFYIANTDVLNLSRGGGYWLWKPYVIFETLKKAKQNDILFYCDAGRLSYYKFSKLPNRLINFIFDSDYGFLLGATVPHLGNLRQWTKRDCLVLMGVGEDNLLNIPVIAATWSLWRPTEKAFDFLEKWLAYCEDRRCLTDDPNVCGLPNYDDFRDHRHDQSILSILAYRESAPFLDFSNTLVHRLIKLRPYSSLGANFYKRPENVNDLLGFDNPLLLVREFIRLKMAR